MCPANKDFGGCSAYSGKSGAHGGGWPKIGCYRSKIDLLTKLPIDSAYWGTTPGPRSGVPKIARVGNVKNSDPSLIEPIAA
jgi:hypothetical protein